MKIYIATCVSRELISDSSTEDIAQDTLWAGHPYPSLELAKQSCQDLVDHYWECDNGEGSVPNLTWISVDDADISALSSECEEIGYEFLIREYEV